MTTRNFCRPLEHRSTETFDGVVYIHVALPGAVSVGRNELVSPDGKSIVFNGKNKGFRAIFNEDI